MKKRNYIKPQSNVIVLHGPTLMISGSNTVNNYNQGSDIIIGDEDDPPSTTNPAKKHIWEFEEGELAQYVSFPELFNNFPEK